MTPHSPPRAAILKGMDHQSMIGSQPKPSAPVGSEGSRSGVKKKDIEVGAVYKIEGSQSPYNGQFFSFGSTTSDFIVSFNGYHGARPVTLDVLQDCSLVRQPNMKPILGLPSEKEPPRIRKPRAPQP